MNETKIIIKLIDDGLLDVNALLIKNRKKLNITENEFFVLSSLARQEVKGNHSFSPEKIKTKTALSSDDFYKALDNLLNKNYLKIVTGINPKSGKQAEFFYIDGLYDKVVEIYLDRIRKENEKKNQSFEEKISELFERTFERPLQVSDAEVIRRWAQEAKYSFEEIQKEILDAKKLGKYSLKYIDSKLVRRELELSNDNEYTNTSKVIQDLSEKWKK
ncbi:MAG: hypothetical protein K6G38_02435 [Gammaproteobacteria bacterium]|nr:hypothetical protein [Gammaproteobacteria bacterium]